MSLLNSSNLIEIKMYYKYIEVETGKKLVILEDDKAKELLKDEEKSKDIEILTTKWNVSTWKEQNEIMALSSKITNPATGETQFNFVAYRDAMVKRCLREWDIMEDKQQVPVSDMAIDSLPGVVVADLYQKFEKSIEYKEEELGN
jgi:hypothetical protein